MSSAGVSMSISRDTGNRTKSNILPDIGLAPLAQVTAFAAAQVEDLASGAAAGAAGRTLVQWSATKLGNQDRLDPVVKISQANDGRLETSLDAHLLALVVW